MHHLYRYSLLAVTLAYIYFGSGVLETITLRPQSIHQWRQCDSASQALNYYQNQVSFLTPQTHTQTGKNGHAASEFPIIYYFVAKLYQLFGFHEYLFRLVNLLIFTAALVAIFSITQKFRINACAGIIPVVMVGTSPYVFYYANNFLPNVPAIALIIIGWCFFSYYLTSGKRIQIVWAFFFFTLGSLIKISESISVVAACIVLAAGYFQLFSLNEISETWRKHGVLKLVLAACCILCIIAWNQYAIWFNKAHGTGQNLLGMLPIWDISRQEAKDIFDRIRYDWSYAIFHRYEWYLFWTALAAFPFFYSRFNPLLRLITLLLFLGVCSYGMLWFQAFYDHDYYMLTFIIFPFFLSLSWVEYLGRIIHLNKVFKLTSILFLALTCGFLTNYSHKVQRNRYFKLKPYINTVLYSIEPYLRSIGVKRTDLVVSVPDSSPNVSLYLMNNPGWTEAFTDENYNINYFHAAGAKYLVISDSSYITHPLYTPFAKHQIGYYRGISIYSLSNL